MRRVLSAVKCCGVISAERIGTRENRGMKNGVESIYRTLVLVLLCALIFVVYREGERIVRNQWTPSEPLQVEVTNSQPLPVEIANGSSDVAPVQAPSDESGASSFTITTAEQQAQVQQHAYAARAAKNGLTLDEQRRFDALYGTSPKGESPPLSR